MALIPPDMHVYVSGSKKWVFSGKSAYKLNRWFLARLWRERLANQSMVN